MSGVANTIGVVPASLSFLAIYNPSLSSGDETVEEQIVYYFDGQNANTNGEAPHETKDSGDGAEQANKRLRSVGLAQAMIQFARFQNHPI